MRYQVNSPSQTEALGAALGGLLAAGDTVLLSGELGAGKSVLARAIARAQGVEGPMPSPTFTLMQPYAGKARLCHYDLYRLEDGDAFYAAGLDEPLGRDLCLIEWPLEDVDIPLPWVRIEIGRAEAQEGRTLDIAAEGLGERQARVLAALKAWEVSA